MSDFLNEDPALDLLAKLVSIDTVNPVFGGPGEFRLSAFVSEWLSERGIAHERQFVLPGRENIVARIGPADRPALLLEAHMDTVGVEGWAKGSPHELVREGDRFYGRGSCDTKASLACFMLTLERFAAAPERLGKSLVFAASVDEESEQLGAVELAKKIGPWRIEEAITGEPTRSDVIYRHKGVGRYMISTSGKAAHASAPELGESAIYKAARICQKIEALEQEMRARPREREIERGTVSVGVIHGGIGFNVVPDRCQVDIDRRIGASELLGTARAELERICGSEPGSSLEIFLERPALAGGASGPFVQRLLEAGMAVGVRNSKREVPYMTNAVAYEESGIPAVVFGPGDIAQAHKNDEYIEAGEMLRCLRVLEGYLSKK